jgi:hypothetical protein
MSYRQIADELGLSEPSIRAVLATPEAKEALEAGRRERTDRVRMALERTGLSAVQALLKGATEGHQSKVAVMSADSILDRIGIPRKQQVEQQVSGGLALDPFAGRSDADCEFYAQHGHWPEEGRRTEDAKG